MKQSSNNTPTRSVLVIGATGRSGQAMLRSLLASSTTVAVHAFVRTPSKLPPELARRCASVITGDGRDAHAVQSALDQANATDVVLCTGEPNAMAVTDVRAATGRALAEAVSARHDESGVATRVAVISSIGAGDSTIRLGWGMGVVMSAYLRRVLKDHNEQERVLRKAFERRPNDLLIVRPTGLQDGDATGRVQVHGPKDVVRPTVNRSDVASWMIGQICGDAQYFGKAVVLSSCAPS